MSYQFLPALSADDYARLRADIEARGIMVPVERDENGDILDGHHRQQIAEELGIDCPSVVRSGMAEHEKRLHAVALNLNRRHLTDAQKVLLGQQIEPDIRERARLRQGERTDLETSRTSDLEVEPVQQSRDDIAAAVGLGSGRTYERAARVLDKAATLAPKAVEAARAGTMSVREVAREVRAAEKAVKVAVIAAAPIAQIPADRTFPVILADPPWRYEAAESPEVRQIENHYPTMSLDEIKAVHVPAGDDAVLFLWATAPKLKEALEVVESWGFDYRTCAVWAKDRIGMGYYFRGQHELLLVARRGSLPVPDASDRPSSVITAPRTEHSAKPPRVYELIETMYPHYAYCELFQRAPREGWHGWGNQAGAA